MNGVLINIVLKCAPITGKKMVFFMEKPFLLEK